MDKTAVFGAGCFWHVQEEFDKIKDIKTEVGYMGGDEENYPNPTYEEIHSNETGYMEVIKIIYNPEKVSYRKLLDVFWEVHNPTSRDRQGANIGIPYRSVIFYFDEEQRAEAEESKKELQKNYEKEIVTLITPAKTFFKAEEYHQKYFQKKNT
jgi:peptide-methionine (S)-S-oxide reductase